MAIKSAELYDPTTGAWKRVQPMHDVRLRHFAARLLDGRVLVAGGWAYKPFEVIGSAEIFDPETETWTVVEPPPAGIWGHGTGTVLEDGRVAVHARASQRAEPLSLLLAFDPATATWSRLARVPEAREMPALGQLRDGSLLVAGGSWPTSELPHPMPEAWLFDLDRGRWKALPPMHEGHWQSHGVRLRDGRVLVTGQGAGDIFDPTTMAWAQTAALEQYRSGLHSAVLLENGDVLVAGDSSCHIDQVEQLVEIYDPVGDSWSTVGRIPHPDGITATGLIDGRVLVVGGGRSCDDHPGGFGPFADTLLFAPSIAP